MASKSKKLFKVIDGLRAWNISSSQSMSSKSWADVDESLKCEHFQVGKIVQHGFPYEPSCMAYDPVQKVIAIGTQHGAIKLLGRPGVACELKHPTQSPVSQIIFMVNEGSLISICQDDSIHLWLYKQKSPDIVHSLQFKKEKLTHGSLSLGSNWLYLGTERGNIHFVNVQRFTLSGYIINWNKAIDLSQSNHPGYVVQISDCPNDPNKILIGFKSGFIVLWDLKLKTAECRFNSNEPLHSLYWHYEGKSFMSSHNHGLLLTWNVKSPQRPVNITRPHARDSNNDAASVSLDHIKKVEWLFSKSGEPFILFTGGSAANSTDPSTQTSVTVVRGKLVSSIPMESAIIDCVSLCESPFPNDIAEPIAMAVLLRNDLVLVDLQSPNYPVFENPYPMSLHEPPVTCCLYLADCPGDLIPALYSIGSRAAKRGANTERHSQREWPITGGEWGTNFCSYPEIIVTGHSDGTIKFWDASAVNLNALYKVRTGKYYEIAPSLLESENTDSGNISSARSCHVVQGLGGEGSSSMAVHKLYMCTESRKLVVAGALHISVLTFSKKEQLYEIPVVDVSIVYSFAAESDQSESAGKGSLPHQSHSIGSYSSSDKGYDPTGGVYLGPPDWEDKEPNRPELEHQSHSVGSFSSSASATDKDLRVAVPVRTGLGKWAPGYQPEVVCRLGTYDSDTAPPLISAIAYSSGYGLLAVGNDCGVAIIDTVQKVLVLTTGTPDLYGSLDPYSRIPWSPNNKREDKSPTNDTFMDNTSSYTQSYALNNETRSPNLSASANTNALGGLRSPALMAKNSSGKGELKRAKSQVEPNKGSIDSRDLNRSCSSSTSSLENVGYETVQSLVFMESYCKRNDFRSIATLWVGTNIGSILAVQIEIPDARTTQSVNVRPSGTLFRMRGELVTVAFLDSVGELLSSPSERWEESTNQKSALSYSEAAAAAIERGNTWRQQARKEMQTRNQNASSGSSVNSFAEAPNENDKQFGVFCSDKQVRVVSMPSHSLAFKAKITETSSVLRAQVIKMKNAPVLTVYLANGHLMTFSLPSLRMLMDATYVPPNDRLLQTFSFANNGYAIHFVSPNEMEKITLSSEMCYNLREMQGEIFVECQMPEAPKRNFIQNFFSGISITNNPAIDRDELFGESQAGKPSVATASFIPNPKMEKLNSQSGGAMSAIAQATKNALERGERLNQLADQSEEMMNQAKAFNKNTSSLASKYEKKAKWGLPF